MTAPHEPRDEGGEAIPNRSRTPPQLSVVHGDIETLLRRLLRLMTREATPELTQLQDRLSYRAPLRGIDTQPPGSKSEEMPTP